MECEALRYVRDDMGLTNVWVMIPFVRTLDEAEGVIDAARPSTAWSAGENGLKVIMMCEIPSNARARRRSSSSTSTASRSAPTT